MLLMSSDKTHKKTFECRTQINNGLALIKSTTLNFQLSIYATSPLIK